MKLNEATKSETTNKQKESRHIVTWTQQEDDILREQISIHGTENWAIIASKFKDKTTRQCRRRWYTYLNSDFKKGGWSPEEDMILCEAQKIFGNRWTEIAKVVSGRTDNAVKNRFTTLCKKRAKHQTISKENKSLCINPNNKRVISQNGLFTEGTSESAAPHKKMRTHISDVTENCNTRGTLGECGTAENQRLRPPFAVIVQNTHRVSDLTAQQNVSNSTSTASNDVRKNKDQGTFIKRDDPRIAVLMQQAELLSSLAAKVNAENTSQTLENAWKELQDFLNQTHKCNLHREEFPETEFRLEDFKELVEDLKSNTIGSRLYWRQPDLHEDSSGSSEYSTESTLQSHTADEKTEPPQTEVSSLHQGTGVEPQTDHMLVNNYSAGCEDRFTGTSVSYVRPQVIHREVDNGGDGGLLERFHSGTNATQAASFLPFSEEPKDNNGLVSALSNAEFSSPIHVTPLFRTFAAAIPSPRFSESERHFLLKTLGSEAMSPNPSPNHSQPPPCRRSLLQSL